MKRKDKEQNYIITPIQNLRRLSPKEEEEAKRLASLSIEAGFKTGNQPEYATALAKMTEKERLAIGKKEANLILDTVRLAEKGKDQELSAEKERLATDRRQLQSVAENTIKGLAEETPKPENLILLTVIPSHFDTTVKSLRRWAKKNGPLTKYEEKIGNRTRVFLDAVEVARLCSPIEKQPQKPR